MSKLESICSSLEENNENFKELDMYELNCNLRSVEEMIVFSKSLEKNHTVEFLNLSCSIVQGIYDYKYIFEALTENYSLRRLDLYGLGTDDNDIKYLSEVLKRNHTLSSIGIGCMHFIGKNGLQHLYNALESNYNLKELVLFCPGRFDIKYQKNIDKIKARVIRNLSLPTWLYCLQKNGIYIPLEITLMILRYF